MKITIDTKEDSKEEIQRVVGMLQQMMGRETYSNVPDMRDRIQRKIDRAKSKNLFEENTSSAQEESFQPFNLFEPKPETSQQTESQPVNMLGSILGPVQASSSTEELVAQAEEAEKQEDAEIQLIEY